MHPNPANPRQGPRKSLKFLEAGGVSPAPFCSMMLADMGAELIRIDRITPSDSGLPVDRRFEFILRSRRSIAMDLKKPEAIAVVKSLLVKSDVLIEDFRPGVMERLGLGPEVSIRPQGLASTPKNCCANGVLMPAPSMRCGRQAPSIAQAPDGPCTTSLQAASTT